MAPRGSESADSQPAGDGEPVVAFETPFFTAFENGHFRLSLSTEEPVFAMRLSDDDTVLPVRGIRRELGIADDSVDGRMLAKVSEALNYVSLLRPGDPLPKEVTTGEASWAISEDHERTAYHRLTMQLASWMTGTEIVFSSREELDRVAADPATKAKVNAALDEAAAKLNLGAGGRETVVAMIEDLAHEMGHIEALRERFGDVSMMLEKARGLERIYAHDAEVRDNANACVRLLTVAVETLTQIFEVIDAQTSEIIAALKNIDAHRDFIRTMRNDLYKRLSAWKDYFAAWRRMELVRSAFNEHVLRRTYRFLAPRFLKADEWELLSRHEPKTARETERRWNLDDWGRETRVTSLADVLIAGKSGSTATG